MHTRTLSLRRGHPGSHWAWAPACVVPMYGMLPAVACTCHRHDAGPPPPPHIRTDGRKTPLPTPARLARATPARARPPMSSRAPRVACPLPPGLPMHLQHPTRRLAARLASSRLAGQGRRAGQWQQQDTLSRGRRPPLAGSTVHAAHQGTTGGTPPPRTLSGSTVPGAGATPGSGRATPPAMTTSATRMPWRTHPGVSGGGGRGRGGVRVGVLRGGCMGVGRRGGCPALPCPALRWPGGLACTWICQRVPTGSGITCNQHEMVDAVCIKRLARPPLVGTLWICHPCARPFAPRPGGLLYHACCHG